MREFRSVLDDLTKSVSGSLQEKETQFFNMKMYIKFMERIGEESSERNQQTEALVAKVNMSNQMLEEMHLREMEQQKLFEELKQQKERVITKTRV